jgi:hypothetical protein
VNRTKNLTVLFLAAAVFAGASCQDASNPNIASNRANAVTSANTATAPAADNTSTAGTPTAAYMAAYTARKNADLPALKKLFSKDLLEFFAEVGGMGEKQQTLDELLIELCEKPQAPTAEARNERITGDKASIEYLDEYGNWSPMEFVKEDGIWKLTIEMPEKGPSQDKQSNRS